MILGLHHITAIAGSPKANYDFYTGIMGLRLVKKTVNFDDPNTYHFYFGNEQGSPGTILTFFPWAHVKPGRIGTGQATEIGYSVPAGSLDFWEEWLKKNKVRVGIREERFGEILLPFRDPDGLFISLVVPGKIDNRPAWTTDAVNVDVATRGFHGVTLLLKDIRPTVAILTEVFGYRLLGNEGNCYRYITDAVENASIVDLLDDPEGQMGVVAGGTNHHVAFRVKDEEELMSYRDKILERGLSITSKIDRNYFFSLYFREPGGILFEIATENPGFAVDEAPAELGKGLKLPSQYESMREAIVKRLPAI